MRLIQRLPRRLRHWVAKIHYRLDPLGYARYCGLRLGKNVRFWGIYPGMLGSEPFLITIGDNVYVSSGVRFVTHDGGAMIFRKDIPDLEYTAPIVIGNDVFIGMGVTILPGVTIGNRCVIGTGSVVTKDIPDNSVAAGCPARVIQSTDQYLEKLKAKSLHCGHLSAGEKVECLKKHFNIEHECVTLYY